MPTQEQLASIAYRLWQQRGCPEGSPEVDWHRARQLLESPPGTAGYQGRTGKAGVERAVQEEALARARSEIASGEYDMQG
jgi:hypothetical protein